MTSIQDIVVRGEEVFVSAQCRWGMGRGVPGELVVTSDRFVFLHEFDSASFQSAIAQKRRVTPLPAGVTIETARGRDDFGGLAPSVAKEVAATLADTLAERLFPADQAAQEEMARRAAKIKSRARAARRTVQQPLRKVGFGERLTAAGERLAPTQASSRRSIWLFWWSR